MADDERTRGAGRRPTVRDVARAAAVSPATVSNVLTGRRAVAPERAARVLAAVERLGYRPDPLAANLRSTRRAVLGVLVPELANPFFAELVEALERRARAAGWRLLVATSGEDRAEEPRAIEELVTWRPAGLVLVPVDDSFPARPIVERSGLPCVLVDRVPPGCEAFDSVAIDNPGAARAATARLLELGHRRILAVASTLAIANMRERVEGVAAAVTAAGARLDLLEAGAEAEPAAAAIAGKLDRSDPPTAIVALTTTLTLAALRALAETGRRVPADCALLGFDDHAWMQVARPAIAAVRQPIGELARLAFDRLRLRAGAEQPLPPCRVRLACDIAWRESIAGPPAPAPTGPSESPAAPPNRGRLNV
ncbi:MAG: LacI family transcriptional regulator [Geminicoccaceae bacterium]|nr:MAG: LacI family transcriptional regulator [Geminicoccaceae bacterium]